MQSSKFRTGNHDLNEADEIRQTAPNMPLSTKIEFENYLRQRYIDVNTSNKLIKRLEKYRIEENQNGEDKNGSK